MRKRWLSGLYLALPMGVAPLMDSFHQWLGFSYLQTILLCLVVSVILLAFNLRQLDKKAKRERDAMERRFAEEDLSLFGTTLIPRL